MLNELSRYYDPTLHAREANRRRAEAAIVVPPVQRDDNRRSQAAPAQSKERSFETVVSIRAEVLERTSVDDAASANAWRQAHTVEAYGETVRSSITSRTFTHERRPEPEPTAAELFAASAAQRQVAAYDAQQRSFLDPSAHAGSRRLLDVRA